MKIEKLGDGDIVVNEFGATIGLNVGTGWYVVGDDNLERVEAFVDAPLGIRGVVTIQEAHEALGL